VFFHKKGEEKVYVATFYRKSAGSADQGNKPHRLENGGRAIPGEKKIGPIFQNLLGHLYLLGRKKKRASLAVTTPQDH